MKHLLKWAGLWSGTYHKWVRHYGQAFEHNGKIPRDHWLDEWEKQAIIKFHFDHPLDGYRRLTYMMLDANIVAVSATTVYRVLSKAGLMKRHQGKPSLKGTGFIQPTRAHQEWHIDVSYINIRGTFYYLCSILDGYSRLIVHWEIREQMKENDIETILQRARESFSDARPRIISDNGPQFIAKDFKEFIRIGGMTHVRTSPYYPQSNGKLERYHRTIKATCIRPKCPLSLDDAQRIVGQFVSEYNDARLHSAIGYITPRAMLEGRQQEIFDERDRKLEAARQRRAEARAAKRTAAYTHDSRTEDRATLGSDPSAASMPVADAGDGAQTPSPKSPLLLAAKR